jgi:hypothetical protein
MTAALWLTILVVFLPAVQCGPQDSLVLHLDSRQHATTDTSLSVTFSSLPISTPGGDKLFPYSGLSALPSVGDLFFAIRFSTGDGKPIAWLLDATVRSRAPPSQNL